MPLSAFAAILPPQVAHVLLIFEPTRSGLADFVIEGLRSRQHLAAFLTLAPVLAEKLSNVRIGIGNHVRVIRI